MSGLLYIPIRTTTSYDLAQNLKKSIEDEYKENADVHTRDLEMLDSCRRQCELTKSGKAALGPLYLYYSHLSLLLPKFPVHMEDDLIWYNTLGYSTNAQQHSKSWRFDQINILYNIGAVLSYIAFNFPTNKADALKSSFQHFQLAAGAFLQLKDKILPNYSGKLPIGLDQDTIAVLYYLCLAQAQECFWVRARLEHLKDGAIAKLSSQVQLFYHTAADYASKSTSIRTEWAHHMRFKAYHFQAAAEYRMAVENLNNHKYGEEIARLQAASSYCAEAMKYSKFVMQGPMNDLQSLTEKVNSDLIRSRKDNDLIYHQDIPQNVAAPSAAGVAKAQIPDAVAKPSEYLRSKGFHPLLENLPPYVLHESVGIFNDRVKNYVDKNILSDIDKQIISMQQEISTLGLPGSLEAISRPLGVPQSLLDHSSEISKFGGIEGIRQAFKDIDDLSNESRALVDCVEEMLETEEAEDEHMRKSKGTDVWSRPPSRVAGKKLWDSLKRIEGYLNDAITSDNYLKQKFSSVDGILTVQANGKEALNAFIPQSTEGIDLSPELKNLTSQMRECLLELEGIKSQYKDKKGELSASVSKVDLTAEMTAHYRQISNQDTISGLKTEFFEPIFAKAVSKYDANLNWVREQVEKQNAILAKLTVLNTAMLNERQMSAASLERENVMQSLEFAYTTFCELIRNLEEGRKFYNGSITQLRNLMDDCSQFTHNRRLEASEIEQQLSAIMGNLSLNVPESHSKQNSHIVSPKPQSSSSWTPNMEIRFAEKDHAQKSD